MHLAYFPKLFSKSRIPFFILRDRRNNALRKMLHFKRESICPCRFLIISKDKKVFPKNFFVWRDIKNNAWWKVFLLIRENVFVVHFCSYLLRQKSFFGKLFCLKRYQKHCMTKSVSFDKRKLFRHALFLLSLHAKKTNFSNFMGHSIKFLKKARCYFISCLPYGQQSIYREVYILMIKFSDRPDVFLWEAVRWDFSMCLQWETMRNPGRVHLYYMLFASARLTCKPPIMG